jgi:hypothetical protein
MVRVPSPESEKDTGPRLDATSTWLIEKASQLVYGRIKGTREKWAGAGLIG